MDYRALGMSRKMLLLKILIQLISIYRAISILIFILFYKITPSEINSLLLVTAISSDLLDGYLARKFNLVSTGGKLLDLFSDKYLNCLSIIFLIIEEYRLLPLLLILTKEIFVLSFRSITIDGKFIITTNRTLGGIMSGTLWLAVFLHINNIFTPLIETMIIILGFLSFIYLVYKIFSNISNLRKAFKN